MTHLALEEFIGLVMLALFELLSIPLEVRWLHQYNQIANERPRSDYVCRDRTRHQCITCGTTAPRGPTC